MQVKTQNNQDIKRGPSSGTVPEKNFFDFDSFPPPKTKSYIIKVFP